MAVKLVTAAQMREIDRIAIQERGVPGLELMERAGRCVADVVTQVHRPGCVGIVTGKGNNAGDGLVVARLLAESGTRIRLLLLTLRENLSEAGRENFDKLSPQVEIVDREQVPNMAQVLADCDILVDAILGTGIEGPVRGTFGEAIALMNGLGKPIVAIDIPSGLHADTGLAEGACVRATDTVTMGLPKLGLVTNDGAEMCGNIHVADIGFPDDLTQDPEIKTHLIGLGDAAGALPRRPISGHKGTFGSLLVIAGSHGMSGAAYLTAATALQSGTGLVYSAFPERVVDMLSSRLIEAVKVPVATAKGDHLTQDAWETLEPYLQKADAVALGPGIGTDEETARLVDELVCQDLPMVIDADALNCLGQKALYLTERAAPTVLTPHPGEMGRLLGIATSEVQGDRIGTATRLAREAKVVVLLKGAQTAIAHPDGRCYLNPISNTGLAKGGSGDVLTGLIGGLLAQGCPALEAACAGAYLHGLAGNRARAEIGARGMTAGDVLNRIPAVLRMAEEEAGIAEKETRISSVSYK
ncbi:NAD(P)H-hydrate dehydratase [Candidatus Sumerlaeota bacterium]|nr:NAD(P)H-hydrate dehydratase [Candidatus Sumerlaeota bacterium]